MSAKANNSYFAGLRSNPEPAQRTGKILIVNHELKQKLNETLASEN
jgi:hypothetical protein